MKFTIICRMMHRKVNLFPCFLQKENVACGWGLSGTLDLHVWLIVTSRIFTFSRCGWILYLVSYSFDFTYMLIETILWVKFMFSGWSILTEMGSYLFLVICQVVSILYLSSELYRYWQNLDVVYSTYYLCSHPLVHKFWRKMNWLLFHYSLG